MEATFDRELHEICLAKGINFARDEAVAAQVTTRFSAKGVKGHQQYVRAAGMESIYGKDLSELEAFMQTGVPWWKRMLQPFIFSRAQKIMDRLRPTHQQADA